MYLFKKLSIIAILLPLVVSAQKVEKNIRFLEQQKIKNIFSSDVLFKTLPDSSAVYAFSFKVTVEKNKYTKTKIVSLTANDSNAYHFYPNYHLLKTINYGLFMKGRKKCTFIIPVALEVYNSKGQKFIIDDFLDKIMLLLHYKPNESRQIEDYIYFKPILLRLNKQIFD